MIKDYMFRIFIWLGNKFFINKEVWKNDKPIKHANYNPGCADSIEVITFSNVTNWQRKHKRSKRYFSISTPSPTTQ